MHLGLVAGLDWTGLVWLETFDLHDKTGNKLAEISRLYSRENDFYQLLQCDWWHDLLPLAVVLWGCAAGLLCVWLFFSVPGLVLMVLDQAKNAPGNFLFCCIPIVEMK